MLRPTVHTEQRLWRAGYRVVAGVDEVGRGAWAGPLVAGAVLLTARELPCLKRQAWFRAVADSKQLSPKLRERIFVAASHEVRWATGVVTSRQVDAWGVAAANRRAIELAVTNLSIPPDMVLVDYVAKLGTVVADCPAQSLVAGDAHVFVIALASILAKVTRDGMVRKLAQAHPGYGFAEHKGYGTPAHAAALARLGPCSAHRYSYRPVRLRLV